MKRRTTEGDSAKMGQTISPEMGISPELVRQVADRVYTMLRRDLKIERERCWRTTSGGERRQSEDR